MGPKELVRKNKIGLRHARSIGRNKLLVILNCPILRTCTRAASSEIFQIRHFRLSLCWSIPIAGRGIYWTILAMGELELEHVVNPDGETVLLGVSVCSRTQTYHKYFVTIIV